MMATTIRSGPTTPPQDLVQNPAEGRHENRFFLQGRVMDALGHEITRLLAAAGSGRQEAWDELTPLIYQELKQIAEAAMRQERIGHTLQPTALVHEAYVRLAGQDASNWNNRVHFYGAAAQTMR